MDDVPQLGKALFTAGIVVAALGALLWAGGKAPGLGRLPGDIVIKRGNFSFYFPLATGIILSIVLTLLFRLLGKK